MQKGHNHLKAGWVAGLMLLSGLYIIIPVASAQVRLSNILIVLKSQERTSLFAAESKLTTLGGRAVHVILPDVIIGYLPEGNDDALRDKLGSCRIERGLVDPNTFGFSGDATRFAVGAWNRLLQGSNLEDRRAGASERKPPNDVKLPGGDLLTSTPFEDRLTSDYMLGRIGVAVILLQGNSGNFSWNDDDKKNKVASEIIQGMEWLASAAKVNGGYVTWIYDMQFLTNPIAVNSEPIYGTSGREYGGTDNVISWIGDAMQATGRARDLSGVFDYANGLRSSAQSDWGFCLFVVNNDPNHRTFTDSDSTFAWTNFWSDEGRMHGGPYFVMTYENRGWGISNMDLITAHETAHIFNASDEYPSPQCGTTSCGDLYGYLQVNNGNCQQCNTKAVSCLMKMDRGFLCGYTLGQIGWVDWDGDSAPQPVDMNTRQDGRLWGVNVGQRYAIWDLADPIHPRFVKSVAVTPDNSDIHPVSGNRVYVWDMTDYNGVKQPFNNNYKVLGQPIPQYQDYNPPPVVNFRQVSPTSIGFDLNDDPDSPGATFIVRIVDGSGNEVARPVNGKFLCDQKVNNVFDFGILPSGNYTAALLAWDGGGNSTNLTTPIEIPPVPSTPTLYSDWLIGEGCKAGSYRPGLHWTQPTGATKYNVKRHWWIPYPPRMEELIWQQYPAYCHEPTCFSYGNFPIQYWVQAGNDAGWSDWSREVEFLYPPGGDPLVSYSDDSLATGYPNGQKIVLDRKDRLHVVFTSGDTVYYTSSNKKAKKWSTPVFVGLGKFPAIAMDSRDNPHVLWTSGTQVLSSQLSNGVWTTPYSLFSSTGATIEAPSFAINTANDSGFASWTEATTMSSEVSLMSFMPGDTTTPVSIQRVDSGGTTSFASPSLTLDPTGKVLVTWSRDGEIYFQERGGSILNLSQSPGNLSIHPVVDAYGDRVSVTYQEQDSTGTFEIKRVVKEDGTWGAAQDLNLFTGNAFFPATAGASQVAFSSDVTGRRDIYYQGMYEDGGFINATALSASSEGAGHNYPSVTLDNDWPNATLHCVWTATPSGGPLVIVPWAIKTIAVEVPPVPSVFVDAGKTAPSSHTIQRAGTVTYGSQPYLTADTHPQKLIYRFTALNPNKRYRLGVTYYFEKPGETWRMRLKVDGRDGIRSKIPSGERVDDSDWLPRSVYQDGVIDVEITPLEGDFALCNEIALYEFDSGKGGGPQEEEGWSAVPLPLTYALGQSYPNPFKDNATISYQLPEETSVSLKVFNIAGQVVRELASGKQKAGYYKAVWDSRDGSGRSVSSGVYFYRLDAGEFSKTNKLVVVR